MYRRPFLAAVCLACTACSIARPQAVLDDEEQVLVDRLQRDVWVDVLLNERRGDGSLLVITHQGEERVHYHIADHDGDGEKEIRRVIEGAF